MSTIKSRVQSFLTLTLAMSVMAFFASCGSENGKKTSAEETVIEEIEGEAMDEHTGHDHASHEGHEHGDDMEPMETLGTDLSFEAGSWAYDLQQAMDNNGTGTFVLDKVPFEGEELSAEADQQLDELAQLLKAHPNARIIIKGHTKEAKNAVGRQTKKATSKARSLWVQTKLSLKGATGDQMRARGMADEELIEGVEGNDDSQSRITVTLGSQE